MSNKDVVFSTHPPTSSSEKCCLCLGWIVGYSMILIDGEKYCDYCGSILLKGLKHLEFQKYTSEKVL